jgi:hypothetical protein
MSEVKKARPRQVFLLVGTAPDGNKLVFGDLHERYMLLRGHLLGALESKVAFTYMCDCRVIVIPYEILIQYSWEITRDPDPDTCVWTVQDYWIDTSCGQTLNPSYSKVDRCSFCDRQVEVKIIDEEK